MFTPNTYSLQYEIIVIESNDDGKLVGTIYKNCTKPDMGFNIKGARFSFSNSMEENVSYSLSDLKLQSIHVSMLNLHTEEPMKEFSFLITPRGIVTDNSGIKFEEVSARPSTVYRNTGNIPTHDSIREPNLDDVLRNVSPVQADNIIATEKTLRSRGM